ncbi:MAG: HAD-IA family hydrolase [Thermoplasmata archaeon]
MPHPSVVHSMRSSGTLADRKAITLDLWYTLVYLPPAERLRYERRRRQLWAEALEASGLSRTRSRLEARRVDRACRADELLGHTPPLEQRAEGLAKEVSAPLDIPGLMEDLEQELLSAGVRLAPGLPGPLERFGAAGIRLGIISTISHETAKATRRLLAELALAPLVSSIVLSAEIERAKPDPEPFEKCLRELSTAAAVAAHIGDQFSDVRGAVGVGMQPVLYSGLQRWAPPHVRANHIEDPHAVPLADWAQAPSLFGLEG